MGRGTQQLPRLIIFDLDGTLIDTEPTSIRAWIDAAREFGLELSQDEVESFIGLNNEAVGKLARKRFGPTIPFEAIFQRKRELGRLAFEQGIALKPGVRELLDTLEALGVRACIATSSGKSRSVDFLRRLDLFHRFEFLISGEDVTNSKPHPEIFQRCLEKAGVAPAWAMVVEDSRNGIIGARASGATAVLIPDVIPADDVMKEQADLEFSSLLEFRAYLLSLFDLI